MAAPQEEYVYIGKNIIKTYSIEGDSKKLAFDKYEAQTKKWHARLSAGDYYTGQLMSGDTFVEVYYYDKINSVRQPKHTRITLIEDDGTGKYQYFESMTAYENYLEFLNNPNLNDLTLNDLTLKWCNVDKFKKRRNAYLAWKAQKSMNMNSP
jgi:hypothetical protein